ncbi:MAG: thiamine-phosphate kinase [Pirellulales bacterium]|nr:thiamine-phosphate kinase [Pirellulales bacterium]
MEDELVAWLRQHLPAHRDQSVPIGDDAAVLHWGTGPGCVVMVDVVMDGVDFELAEVAASRVGHKALAVNLSDLAAMAARPRAAVVALVLPRHGGAELARELYAGMIPLAERYDVALAGGDINSWDGRLVVSVTAIGQETARGPLRRSGARPGDWIVVTGSLGGSRLAKHLDFEPRVNEALLLHERYALHAGIDISDGLTLDLARLCEASGCGSVIDLASVPIDPAAGQWARQLADGSTALDHALSDGEDFELVLTLPADEAARLVADQPLEIPVTRIGEIVAERGLWQRDATGIVTPLVPRGFQHELDKP